VSIRRADCSQLLHAAAKVAERSSETVSTTSPVPAPSTNDAARCSRWRRVDVHHHADEFIVLSAGLSAFWSGFFRGMNYAVSFVLIQLLHWTVATKQPAMTARQCAAKLKELGHPGAIEGLWMKWRT